LKDSTWIQTYDLAINLTGVPILFPLLFLLNNGGYFEARAILNKLRNILDIS